MTLRAHIETRIWYYLATSTSGLKVALAEIINHIHAVFDPPTTVRSNCIVLHIGNKSKSARLTLAGSLGRLLVVTLALLSEDIPIVWDLLDPGTLEIVGGSARIDGT